MKLLFAFLPFTLLAQTVSMSTANVNIQFDSATVIKAKYRIKLPKGVWAASVVAENDGAGTMYIGQGSIIKALRDKGYPALGRTDAAAVILHAQSSGFSGFVVSNLPFVQKLMNDTEGLIVARALSVSPTTGIIVAGVSAALNIYTPDILAQIQQFEQTYDTDGLQNITQLGPGQSAIGTIILDSPNKYVLTDGHSFVVNVPVVQVTGQQQVSISK